jgi:hypothetical protein
MRTLLYVSPLLVALFSAACSSGSSGCGTPEECGAGTFWTGSQCASKAAMCASGTHYDKDKDQCLLGDPEGGAEGAEVGGGEYTDTGGSMGSSGASSTYTDYSPSGTAAPGPTPSPLNDPNASSGDPVDYGEGGSGSSGTLGEGTTEPVSEPGIGTT